MDTVQLMVDNGILSAQQAEEAKSLASRSGGPVLKHVQDKGYVGEKDMVSFLVRASNLHYIKISSVELDMEAARLMDPALRRELLALPVRKSRTALAVAMVDPLDEDAINRIRESTAYQVLPFIAGKSEIEEGLVRVERSEKALRVAGPPSQQAPSEEGPVLRWGKVDAGYSLRDFVAPEGLKKEITQLVETIGNSSDKGGLVLVQGDPETGKTHLLNGLIKEIHLKNRELAMAFFACRDFVGEFIATMKRGEKNEFRNSLMSLDVLAIDEIDFLEGKERFQKVVLKLLNLFVWKGKKAIIASRPWYGASRFEEGLKEYIVDVTALTLLPQAEVDAPGPAAAPAPHPHEGPEKFREQLDRASTTREVLDVVQRAFMAKVRSMNSGGARDHLVLGRMARVAEALEEGNLSLAFRLWKHLGL